jgi:hypothetical protein
MKQSQNLSCSSSGAHESTLAKLCPNGSDLAETCRESGRVFRALLRPDAGKCGRILPGSMRYSPFETDAALLFLSGGPTDNEADNKKSSDADAVDVSAFSVSEKVFAASSHVFWKNYGYLSLRKQR